MFILSDHFDIFFYFYVLTVSVRTLHHMFRFCSLGENIVLDLGHEPGLRSKGGSCTYLKVGTQCVRIQSHMIVN